MTPLSYLRPTYAGPNGQRRGCSGICFLPTPPTLMIPFHPSYDFKSGKTIDVGWSLILVDKTPGEVMRVGLSQEQLHGVIDGLPADKLPALAQQID